MGEANPLDEDGENNELGEGVNDDKVEILSIGFDGDEVAGEEDNGGQ